MTFLCFMFSRKKKKSSHKTNKYVSVLKCSRTQIYFICLRFVTAVFRISLKIKAFLLKKFKMLDLGVFKNFKGKDPIPLHVCPVHSVIVSSVSQFLNYWNYKV